MFDWEAWARSRGWIFHPGWPQILARFGGGGLRKGVLRDVPLGFEGRFGEYPCFSFLATAGSDPWGALSVVALRVPGAQFPALSVTSVLETVEGPHVDIGAEFNLEWQAIAPSSVFARDVLVPKVVAELGKAEFEFLWFEHDSILFSTRRDLYAEDIDEYLTILHRIIDAIPVHVLAAVGAGRALPVPQIPVVRPGPMARQRFQFGTSSDAWRAWTTQRQWLFASSADIHGRLKYKLPVSPDGHGFVGKFGDLPVFGFQASPLRNVVGVRVPGTRLPVVALSRDDEVMVELMGAGDLEVGDPAFDYAWRIRADDVDAARILLRPQLRQCFDVAPPFDRLWFGGDAIALITTQAIAPGSVDGLLTWLLDVAGQLPLTVSDNDGKESHGDI